MGIVQWLFGQRSENCDKVDAALGRLADTVDEANLKLRIQAGLIEPTKSRANFEQMMGRSRALVPANGKTK